MTDSSAHLIMELTPWEQTNLPNFRATQYRNMQRSYVEFQTFAEQLAVGNPHGET